MRTKASRLRNRTASFKPLSAYASTRLTAQRGDHKAAEVRAVRVFPGGDVHCGVALIVGVVQRCTMRGQREQRFLDSVRVCVL